MANPRLSRTQTNKSLGETAKPSKYTWEPMPEENTPKMWLKMLLQ